MTSPPALSTGCYYHIYNRGVDGQDIFIEERNYAYFLTLYTRHVHPFVDTYAYCLLKNHFHLFVRIKSPEDAQLSKNIPDFEASQTLKVSNRSSFNSGNPSKTFRVFNPSNQFSKLFNAYAKSINKAYGRTGSLFQHPFQRVIVKDDRQFWNVIRYIHQNPQKHGFAKDFRRWKYSSYQVIPSSRATLIDRDMVLSYFGGVENFIRTHAEWEQNLNQELLFD